MISLLQACFRDPFKAKVPMTSKRLIPILAVLTLVLSSCGDGTEAFCKVTYPVVLKDDDVLSAGTQQEIIANDEARQQLCGRFDGHKLFDLGIGSKAEDVVVEPEATAPKSVTNVGK